MTREKGLLTGAWAVMAAVGAFSIYRQSQAPQIDPSIAILAGQLDKKGEGLNGPVPPPVPPTPTWPGRMPDAGYMPPPDDAGLVHTKLVGKAVPPTACKVHVLPFPVMSAAKSDLNGVALSWTTVEPKVELLLKMERTPAKAFRFAVFRQRGSEAPEKIADLGPEARSYTDLSAAARETYHYWVSLTGAETVRFDRSGSMVQITNKAEIPLTATTPATTRLKLVGGDNTHALVRVETYDRAAKNWVGKAPVLAAPGEKVAGTGWSVKGLRFTNFTLVADMTDDDGVAQVLTTGN